MDKLAVAHGLHDPRASRYFKKKWKVRPRLSLFVNLFKLFEFG